MVGYATLLRDHVSLTGSWPRQASAIPRWTTALLPAMSRRCCGCDVAGRVGRGEAEGTDEDRGQLTGGRPAVQQLPQQGA